MARGIKLVIEGSVANNPELMRYWDTERNTVSPSTVLEKTIAYMHFRCPDNPEHRWMAKVSDMARNCKCPGCIAGADRKLPQRRRVKRGNSFAEAHPDIAKEWYQPYNGIITPYHINRCSANKYWFCCDKHDVIWETKPYLRGQKGSSCPLCKLEKLHSSNSRPPEGGSLGDLYPDLASEWHKKRNGDVTPFDICPQSHTDFWWTCRYNKSHVWRASPHNRINGGTGCPECSKWQHTSFPEKAIYYYVSKAFPDVLESHNPNPDVFGRKTFDIYIPSEGIAIEYDGQTWHGDENRDIEKDLLCLRKGIRVIRVREPECPVYSPLLTTYYVFRQHTTSFESLDICIKEVLRITNANIDFTVDTEADAPEIYNLLSLSRSKHSVAERYPELVAEWDPEDNNGLELSAFRPSSTYKGTWTCDKNHKYVGSIRHRCAGHGCRKCKLMKPKPGKSLRDICPNIAEEWAYATDGSTVTPDDVGPSSSLEVHWKCSSPSCDKEWDASVVRRTQYGDKPYCRKCRSKLPRSKKSE